MEVRPDEHEVAPAGVAGADLLGLPVRVRGIDLGRSVELLVDLAQGRVLGFEVLCGDGRNRFLPLTVTRHTDRELSLFSSLVLVDDEDAAFYRRRAFRLGSLRTLPVEHDGEPVGQLRDVVFDRAGLVTAVLVDSADGQERISCPSGLKLRGGVVRC